MNSAIAPRTLTPARSARITRAIQLRDAGISVLRANCKMVEVQKIPGRVASASIGDIELMHRTPFQRLPESSEKVKYLSALLAQRGFASNKTLPYGLDIWYVGRKVFSVQWSADDAALTIVAFRRGPWEEALLESA